MFGLCLPDIPLSDAYLLLCLEMFIVALDYAFFSIKFVNFVYMDFTHEGISVRAGIYVSACIFCAYMSNSFQLYKGHPKKGLAKKLHFGPYCLVRMAILSWNEDTINEGSKNFETLTLVH